MQLTLSPSLTHHTHTHTHTTQEEEESEDEDAPAAKKSKVASGSKPAPKEAKKKKKKKSGDDSDDDADSVNSDVVEDLSGRVRTSHAIWKATLIDDSQCGPCNVTNLTPGSDCNPRRAYGGRHQLMTPGMIHGHQSDNPTRRRRGGRVEHYRGGAARAPR
jgi:hypothetical protein